MKRIHHLLLAALVFLLTGMASYGLWQHERNNAAANHRAQLDFNLREIAGNIEQRMASYEQVMRGVQGLVAVSGSIASQKLPTYLDALQMGPDFAGLEHLGVVAAQADPKPPHPYANPALRTSMEAARDSGLAKLSGKIGTGTAGKFLIFMPLYPGDRPPNTQAERRASLLGWVVASVHMGDLMASLYGQRTQINDIQVHDGVTQSEETLMYDSLPAPRAAPPAADALTEYLVLSGRTWAITVQPRAGAVSTLGRDDSTLLALGGAVFTLLLTLFTWLLTTARSRALAKATEMTAELREVKERFELLFDTSPDAVVVSRLSDRVVVEANSRCTAVTGYARHELVGKPVSDMQLWSDPQAHQRFSDAVHAHGYCENFEARFRMKDGSERVGLISGRRVHIQNVPHVISITRDISERKEIEVRMTHMAQHDSLTNLPNRALFYDRLQQALAHARRDQARLALMFLDLDHFKPVNDTFGHAVGDLLLKEAASRMVECVRASDTVGRIGGDEFVILLPEIRDNQDALLVALKIRQAMEAPFLLPGGHTVQISCSTGIATYPEHGSDEIELSKNADAGMYLAKDRGRNRVELFSAV